MIPHRFPFRLLEAPGSENGSVRIRITGGGWWVRGGIAPSFLAVEMLAQASIVALGEELTGVPAGDRILLAGVQNAHFHDSLRPGDSLLAKVTLEARFGRILKVSGSLDRDESPVFEGSLLLAWEA